MGTVAENHQVARIPPEFVMRRLTTSSRLLKEKQIEVPQMLHLARRLPIIGHAEVAYASE